MDWHFVTLLWSDTEITTTMGRITLTYSGSSNKTRQADEICKQGFHKKKKKVKPAQSPALVHHDLSEMNPWGWFCNNSNLSVINREQKDLFSSPNSPLFLYFIDIFYGTHGHMPELVCELKLTYKSTSDAQSLLVKYCIGLLCKKKKTACMERALLVLGLCCVGLFCLVLMES